MKALVCCLLLSIASLVYASEELIWTPVSLPGLKVVQGGAEDNIGIWFHGDFGWLNSGFQLWVSHDAGRSWMLSLKPPVKQIDERIYESLFYDVYFVNESEGWAVEDAFPHSLFHTKDGGISWEEIQFTITQTSNNHVGTNRLVLARVYFKDSLNGLGVFAMIGETWYPYWLGGLIARTKDGGQNWIEVGRGFTFPHIFGFGDQVQIVDSLSNSTYTSDFGNTFRQVFAPNYNVSNVIWGTPFYGWALVHNYLGNDPPLPYSRHEVLMTNDAGNTWSAPIFSKNFLGHDSGILAICLMSEDVGAVLCYSEPGKEDTSSHLYMTYDKGFTWTSYPAPIPLSSWYSLPIQIRPDPWFILNFNQQRREIWLFPIYLFFSAIETKIAENILYYASIDTTTSVHSSGKLFTTWAWIKKMGK